MKSKRTSPLKPRNPFVAPARFRRAGAHANSARSRQAARAELRKQLQALKEVA